MSFRQDRGIFPFEKLSGELRNLVYSTTLIGKNRWGYEMIGLEEKSRRDLRLSEMLSRYDRKLGYFFPDLRCRSAPGVQGRAITLLATCKWVREETVGYVYDTFRFDTHRILTIFIGQIGDNSRFIRQIIINSWHCDLYWPPGYNFTERLVKFLHHRHTHLLIDVYHIPFCPEITAPADSHGDKRYEFRDRAARYIALYTSAAALLGSGRMANLFKALAAPVSQELAYFKYLAAIRHRRLP